MSQYDEILAQVPTSQLADQFGVDEAEVTRAAEQALPALLGGLRANAEDPAGASSILQALPQHQGEAPRDLGEVDVADGSKIVGHIFGDNTDEVVNRLGGLGGGASGGLVKKLLPILAPIVLSWLAGKMNQRGGLGGVLGDLLGGGARGGQAAPPPSTGSESGPLFPGGQGSQSEPVQPPTGTGSTTPAEQASDPLQDILGGILGGAGSGAGSGGGSGAGSIIGDLLGGLLGGGRR